MLSCLVSVMIGKLCIIWFCIGLSFLTAFTGLLPCLTLDETHKSSTIRKLSMAEQRMDHASDTGCTDAH